MLSNMLRRLTHHLSRYSRAYTVLAVIAGLFLAGSVTYAAGDQSAVLNKLSQIMANLVFLVIQTVGYLTAVATHVIVILSLHNNFINVPIVVTGWSIVRDITNMFFIVTLLIIAVGTVLRIENYRYNRLLARLIIMAFLVNFSRLIAGFFIQTSQVVMLTFVNSYKDALFGNFASLFGLNEILNFSQTSVSSGGNGIAFSSIFVSLLAGLALMVTALIVTLAFAVILTVRIVALWILVILSPLAYALRILPNTEGYARKWWSEFGRYVTVGPVIAFILWLSLAILTNAGPNAGINIGGDAGAAYEQEIGVVGSTFGFVTGALQLNHFLPFLVAIIFMVMGLQYAMQSGTYGAKAAGAFGVGVGLGATGVNWLRDRTIRPIQGVFQQRSARRQAEVRERSVALGARVDAGLARTVGQIGRARAATTSAAGASLRGVRDVALRRKTVQEAGRDIDSAAQTGFEQGTRSRRQALGRYEQFRETLVDREIKERDLSNASAGTINTLLRTGGGATRAAAATVGLQSGKIDLNDLTNRDVVSRTIKAWDSNPDVRTKLSSSLAKAVKRPETTNDTLRDMAMNNTAPLSMRMESGEELANRGHVQNVAEAQAIRDVARQMGPDREEQFLKTMYKHMGDMSISAFHNDFATQADTASFVAAVEREAASKSILKSRHLQVRNGAAGDELGQQIANMYIRQGMADKAGQDLSEQMRDQLYNHVVLDNVDFEDRQKFANATGATHRAFRDANNIMTQALNEYLSRNADKMADVMTESVAADADFMTAALQNRNFRRSNIVKAGERNAAMRDAVVNGLQATYGGLVNPDDLHKAMGARLLISRGEHKDFDFGDVAGQAAFRDTIAAAKGEQLGRLDQGQVYQQNKAFIDQTVGEALREKEMPELGARRFQLARDAVQTLLRTNPRLYRVYAMNPNTANLA